MDPQMLADMFGADGFSATTLTATINTLPYVPQRIGNMELFEEDGIPTTTMALEELDGTIGLIPNTPRDAAPNPVSIEKRTLRQLNVPHLPIQSVILPSQIQNVRAYGSASQFQTVETLIKQRMNKMTRAHAATLEYQRMGALKGIILDADGSTIIYNLFTEFGVSQTTQDFTLGTPTTDVGGLCEGVSATIENVLGAMVFDHVHVLCGKTWWREFITHTKVADSYKYYQQNNGVNPNNQDLRYKGFTYEGLMFEQYRGKVGNIGFIADNEAYAFPVGVPGLFITRFAPAEYMDTVNTIGLPMYARPYVHPKLDGIDIDMESNPLSICTRPGVLVKLTTSN